MDKEDWRYKHDCCWVCNCKAGSCWRPLEWYEVRKHIKPLPFRASWRYVTIELHHIERRSQAAKDRVDWPENWFAGCRECHAGPLATMPHARQLALKWRHDRCGHEDLASFLEKWHQIRAAGENETRRVSVEDVEEELEKR